MRAIMLVLALAAGCARVEGGLTFQYALFMGSTTTPARSCAVAGVTTIRVILANDANADQLVSDDEMEGRAVQDCNGGDSNGDGTLSPFEYGTFETAEDRLPAGAYDLIAIELSAGFQNKQYAVFDDARFAERWNFYDPDGDAVVEIRELEMTTFDFRAYSGGNFMELRATVR